MNILLAILDGVVQYLLWYIGFSITVIGAVIAVYSFNK